MSIMMGHVPTLRLGTCPIVFLFTVLLTFVYPINDLFALFLMLKNTILYTVFPLIEPSLN